MEVIIDSDNRKEKQNKSIHHPCGACTVKLTQKKPKTSTGEK